MTSLVSAIGEAVGISKNSIRGLTTFISDVRACTNQYPTYSEHLKSEITSSTDPQLAPSSTRFTWAFLVSLILF